jgi:DNA polymerase
VKDRPPENRDPTPMEIKIYGPFLDRQIDIIRPRVLATLGRFSMDYIMRKFDLTLELEPIGKIHGKIFDAEAPYGEIKIAVLYHPAMAVYNPNNKDMLKGDFEVLREV